jgi:hypothetical protein
MRVTIALVLLVAASFVASGTGASAAAASPEISGSFTVSPTTDLVDGQVVSVHGTGFEDGGGYLSLWQCEAGGRPHLQDCNDADQDDPIYDLGPRGTFDVTFRLEAAFVLESGRAIDCRDAPGTCVITLFAEDPSGIPDVPLSFDPTAPLDPPPTVTVTPSDLVDGQMAHAEVTGFRPNTGARVKVCNGPSSSARCHEGEDLVPPDDAYADASGSFGVDFRARAVVTPGELYTKRGSAGPPAAAPFDCRVVDCYLVVTEWTDGNGEGVAPLDFDPDSPLHPAATMTVTPSTGLAPTQRVAVHVENLFPGEDVEITQCSVDISAYGQGFCHEDELRVVADADGVIDDTTTLFERFDIWEGLDHTAADCAATACAVVVWRWSDDARPGVVVAVHFASEGTAAVPATPSAVSPRFTG